MAQLLLFKMLHQTQNILANLSFLDILTILSFLVGVENLSLNDIQIKNLDKHLQEQDKELKQKQDEMLMKIIEQNQEIIKLFKEKNNA